MKKTYVLDTNVLIQSPHAFLNFEDNDIIIPFVVLEELDGLKKSDGEKGSNAREAVRKLEEFRICGNILDGITIEDGGTLRVERNYKDIPLPEDLSEDKSDNRILQVCKGLKRDCSGIQEGLIWGFLFLFFISKVTLSVEHNFTEEMEEKQNTVMFK